MHDMKPGLSCAFAIGMHCGGKLALRFIRESGALHGIVEKSKCAGIARDGEKWPPWCCVAALVVKALELFGVKGVDRANVAAAVGTHVDAGEANPWLLPVTTAKEEMGVTAQVAARTIPEVLAMHDATLTFRHIRFSEIDLRMHGAVFEEAKDKGCIVGVGFNYAMLMNKDGCLRHVARIVSGECCGNAVLVDDHGLSNRIVVSWRYLERAVYSVSDGYWVFGRVGSLGFEMAPLR